MITVINGYDHTCYSDLLDQMHCLRAEVFRDRLGWEVEVIDGRETDRFDQLDPTYLLSIDDAGILRGCLRLLQTTGPNMLSDVFSELLPDGEKIESPLIWESTRFAVRKGACGEINQKSLSRITAELIAGVGEIGLQTGLISVVSVFDAMTKRILERIGCEIEIIGVPKKIGNVMTYAGVLPISEDLLAHVKEQNGIEGSVLRPESLEAIPRMMAAIDRYLMSPSALQN